MKGRVRAVIIQDRKALLLKRTKKDQPVYYAFPGGGIEPEDKGPESALERECMEELGLVVHVGKEIYGHEFKGEPDVFYMCDIVSGTLRSEIGGPEAERSDIYGEYEILWVDLKDVDALNVQPTAMKTMLK